jgi:type II secretory pathway component GspD/PulD (secretin)
MKRTRRWWLLDRCLIPRVALLAFMGFGFIGVGVARGDDGTPIDPSEVLLSLDADSTSLASVLQILAEKSGLNIVTGPEVVGKRISIHLWNTPFDEALSLVVRTAGLGFERVGRSILVTGLDALASPTGLATRVFDLRYADAEDLRAMLEVITKDVKANAVGNRLVIRATGSGLQEAAAVIAELDRKPQQILLQARLVEVDTSALLELGIDWEKITKWSTVVTEGNQGATAKGAIPEKLPYLKLDQTATWYRQMQAFDVAVDALLSDGNARLLANSSVVTLDGTAAEIFAGETVPVVISSLVSPGATGGALQTVQLEKIDVGVKLNITPRIGDEGLITVLVKPEISQITRYVGPNSDLPETSSRRADTYVRVKDGEKIFIGGLLTTEKRSTVQKVPLLGSIPLLGHFFRHYRNETRKLDVVIEITPRIVGDDGGFRPVVEGEGR